MVLSAGHRTVVKLLMISALCRSPLPCSIRIDRNSGEKTNVTKTDIPIPQNAPPLEGYAGPRFELKHSLRCGRSASDRHQSQGPKRINIQRTVRISSAMRPCSNASRVTSSLSTSCPSSGRDFALVPVHAPLLNKTCTQSLKSVCAELSCLRIEMKPISGIHTASISQFLDDCIGACAFAQQDVHAIVETHVLAESNCLRIEASVSGRSIFPGRVQQCERAQTHRNVAETHKNRRGLFSLSQELHTSGHRICGNDAPHAELGNVKARSGAFCSPQALRSAGRCQTHPSLSRAGLS